MMGYKKLYHTNLKICLLITKGSVWVGVLYILKEYSLLPFIMERLLSQPTEILKSKFPQQKTI